MVLELPSGTWADPSPTTWMCWQDKPQAGVGQVPHPSTSRHTPAGPAAPHLQQICWQQLRRFLGSAEEAERAISRWGDLHQPLFGSRRHWLWPGPLYTRLCVE